MCVLERSLLHRLNLMVNRSPFPGMDPWLERFWGDIHSRFVVYLADQVNERLPRDLQARVEESLTVDTDDYRRTIYPDSHVVEEQFDTSTGNVAIAVAQSTAIATQPMLVSLGSEHRTQRHIEIIDRNSGGRVVTAIELLSPANKCSELGRKAYHQKQHEYRSAGVNLMEIDLVRDGAWILALPDDLVPAECRSPYMICVRRVTRPSLAELFPVSLREPLPNVLLPLRPADADILVQLQPLLDDCYRRGRYDSLDYSRPLSPPLNEADHAWAMELIRQHASPV